MEQAAAQLACRLRLLHLCFLLYDRVDYRVASTLREAKPAIYVDISSLRSIHRSLWIYPRNGRRCSMATFILAFRRHQIYYRNSPGDHSDCASGPNAKNQARSEAVNVCSAERAPVCRGSRMQPGLPLSRGISVYPETGQTVEALLTNADAAMYKAKAEGGNSSETYTRALELTASRERQLEDCMKHALELNEFELVY